MKIIIKMISIVLVLVQISYTPVVCADSKKHKTSAANTSKKHQQHSTNKHSKKTQSSHEHKSSESKKSNSKKTEQPSNNSLKKSDPVISPKTTVEPSATPQIKEAAQNSTDQTKPLPTPVPKTLVNQTQPLTSTAPKALADQAQPLPPVAPKALPVDCLYQLSSTVPVTETVLSQWAQLAATQSFNYRFDQIDKQLKNLKGCYTEQGWLGFQDALTQSGNLNMIKTQQLTVNSQVEGKVKINPLNNNHWKILIPLKVIYQNTQEKLTQRLTVELLVTKKPTSQLGITQIVAEAKSQ